MSARANVFIRERGIVTFFRSRWGEQLFHQTLWYGPSGFLESVWDSSWVPPSVSWVVEDSAVWSGVAALVDLDHRTLLFFGGSPFDRDPVARRTSVAFTRLTWRGWHVAHADEGASELFRWLEKDDSPRGAGEAPPDESPTAAPSEGAGARTEESVVERVAESPSYVVTLENEASVGLVVRMDPGPLWVSSSRLPMILSGPAAIDTFSDGPYLSQLPHESTTRGGALLDRRTRLLRIWHYATDEVVIPVLKARLPNWDIAFLADGYPGHVAAAGGSEDRLSDPSDFLDAVFLQDRERAPRLLSRLVVPLVRNGFAPGRLLFRPATKEITYEDVRPWLVACVRGVRYATTVADAASSAAPKERV